MVLPLMPFNPIDRFWPTVADYDDISLSDVPFGTFIGQVKGASVPLCKDS